MHLYITDENQLSVLKYDLMEPLQHNLLESIIEEQLH